MRFCHPEVNDIMQNGLADKVYTLNYTTVLDLRGNKECVLCTCDKHVHMNKECVLCTCDKHVHMSEECVLCTCDKHVHMNKECVLRTCEKRAYASTKMQCN